MQQYLHAWVFVTTSPLVSYFLVLSGAYLWFLLYLITYSYFILKNHNAKANSFYLISEIAFHINKIRSIGLMKLCGLVQKTY